MEYGEITDINLVDNHCSMNSSKKLSIAPEMQFMSNEIEINKFRRTIMYATTLLTELHVFDDDFPYSIFDITSGR